MNIENEELYKIVVFLPEKFLTEMMDAVEAVTESIFPGYERAFSYFPVTGTWRTLVGADPYSGKAGEISVDDEIRLEFAVYGKDVMAALRAIRAVHPYEAPAMDVLPMMSGLRLLNQPFLGSRQ